MRFVIAKTTFRACDIATYVNKHCWRAFWGYQHRWLWTTL